MKSRSLPDVVICESKTIWLPAKMRPVPLDQFNLTRQHRNAVRPWRCWSGRCCNEKYWPSPGFLWKTHPSLSWILVLITWIVSQDFVSRVIVVPVNVFTKICIVVVKKTMELCLLGLCGKLRRGLTRCTCKIMPSDSSESGSKRGTARHLQVRVREFKII